MSQYVKSPRAIRILLAEIQNLDSDILKRKILAQPDMEITCEVSRAEEVEGILQRHAVDVIVTSLATKKPPDVYQRLLFESPHTPLVVITQAGGRLEIFDRRIAVEVS